jgi:glutathione S-transferase
LRPIPALIRSVAGALARRTIVNQLHAQGYGRHSLEDTIRLGKMDVDAIATMLGEQRYLLGDEPTSFDATGYAFIGNLVHIPQKTELSAHAQSHANLVRYANHMRDRYFGDKRAAA